jgi:hypothetical protein
MESRWRKIRFVVLPVAAALTLASGPVASTAYAHSLTRAAQAQKARSAQASLAHDADGTRPANYPPKPKTPERQVSASAVILAAPKVSKPTTLTATFPAWGPGADGNCRASDPCFTGFVPLGKTPAPVVPHRPAYHANAPPKHPSRNE